jgi:hypothetical protein
MIPHRRVQSSLIGATAIVVLTLLVLGVECAPRPAPPGATGEAVAAPGAGTPVGVPSVDPDFHRSVRSWWETHPLNPRYAGGIPVGAIPNPEPSVNVRQEYGGDIQAAIESLPEAGGTLFLEPGTYQHNISLIGRSNIHIVSEQGATILGGLASSSSLETDANIAGSRLAVRYGWFADCLYFRNRPDHEACTSTVQSPARNIYFRNVTFDGNNTAQMAFFIRAMRDIVFDNVTFVNFLDPWKYHAGPVNSNATAANIWCRRCHFIGSQSYAWVMDGLHGGGVIDSTFERAFHAGAILLLTNDDFTNDFNGDGVIDLAEQRVSQYVIVSGNTFAFASHIIDATSSNTIVENNRALEGATIFVNFDIRHANRNTRYQYFNNTVVNNLVKGASVLVDIGNRGTCQETSSGVEPLPVYCSDHGRYTIRDNVVLDRVEHLATISSDRLRSPVTMANNCVAGFLWSTTTACTMPSLPAPASGDVGVPVVTSEPPAKDVQKRR